MRALTRRDLELISQRVLRAYWRLPASKEEPDRINPDLLLTSLLGLRIDYRPLSSDGSLLGVTSFDEIDIEIEGSSEMYPLDGRTVLIDSGLQRDGACVGRRNFTVGHEGSHHILEMLFPGEYGGGVCGRSVVKYRAADADRLGAAGRDREEWQMDVLTSALLIPQLLLHRNMKRMGIPNGIPILNRLWRRDEYDAFVGMCGVMGVSKQAMACRMERLGLIGENA